jgi:hypothetical protein
MSPY